MSPWHYLLAAAVFAAPCRLVADIILWIAR